jgi:hypothetical protein
MSPPGEVTAMLGDAPTAIVSDPSAGTAIVLDASERKRR